MAATHSFSVTFAVKTCSRRATKCSRWAPRRCRRVPLVHAAVCMSVTPRAGPPVNEPRLARPHDRVLGQQQHGRQSHGPVGRGCGLAQRNCSCDARHVHCRRLYQVHGHSAHKDSRLPFSSSLLARLEVCPPRPHPRHRPTNVSADAQDRATTTPPPASCTSTPVSCTTPSCSRCSPPKNTTTSSEAATVAGVKCILSWPRVSLAMRRPSHSCTHQRHRASSTRRA
jgi:hypothetical protein